MSIKVLVVDDSTTTRQITLRTLREAGVRDVVEAEDGHQAIQQFREHAPGLIMLDWNIPGKNGLDVLQEVRSLDANVPVVMVTTEAEKPQMMNALFAGANDYLVKPFSAAALSDKLKSLVSIR